MKESPPEVPVEKLKTEHLSKPRNTLLADVFYKAGFIESWGRGTIKGKKIETDTYFY